MRSFQDTFEALKRSFISADSICMALPLGGLYEKLKNKVSYNNCKP